MRAFASLLLVAVLVGCGGGGSDKVTGPKNTDVGGAWRITFSNLHDAGNNLRCDASGTMNFAQNGATFSGSYALSGACVTAAGQQGPVTAAGQVASGTVSGSSVAFDFDTQDWHYTGAVSGTSMSGTLTDIENLPGVGQITMTGTWSATRP